MSPFNVHPNAANIFAVGTNKQKLDSAYAIELPVSGTKRSDLIRFNEVLVSKSNGLLAPWNGNERYATVGCGHTTA